MSLASLRTRLKRLEDQTQTLSILSDETIELPSPQEGKQTLFYECEADIVIYGGAAGAGKSAGLLTKVTKNLKTRGFGAVIFRLTSPEIRNEGGLWDESLKFYQDIPGAIARESLLDWHFPWGSTISFAHADKLRQKFPGAQMAHIGIDELQFWDEGDFWFLLSRNRTTCGVKPRLDATCNPDADCFVAKLIEWYWDKETGYPIEERSGVIRYFYRINEQTYWGDTAEELEQTFPDMAAIAPPKSFTFIPGTVDDNPALLRVNPQYKANLLAQHPVDCERLLRGNWLIRFSAGTIFQRTWFEVVDEAPAYGQTVRFWDLAATAKDSATEKSFYTCGMKMRRVGNTYYIVDLYWEQVGADEGDFSIVRMASQDGKQCIVAWELEGGSAALRYEATLRGKLSSYICRPEKPRGDKVTRALPWATAAKNGQVKVLRSVWNDQFFTAVERFNGQRIPLISDIVDAGSGAYDLLFNSARAAVPTGGEVKQPWQR